MNGFWDNPRVPQKGWRCESVYDVRQEGDSPDETDYKTCQMCGKERIRFVHVMAHDEYEENLEVGCVCAEKMSNDYTGPKLRERELRNKAARHSKWLTRKWKQNFKGNYTLKTQKHSLTVYQDSFLPGNWKCFFDNQPGKLSYDSIEKAKLALFEKLWRVTHPATTR